MCTKLVILFSFLFLISPIIVGQNLKKGFRLVEEKKFDAALEIFKESVKKQKMPLVAKYGMALIYFDKEYSKYSLPNAYKSLKSAQGSFEKTNEDLKKEIESDYQITAQTFDKFLCSIIDSAFSNALKINSIEAFEDFIQSYETSKKRIKEAKIVRDSLAFLKAKQIDNFDAYDSFMRRYPYSKQYGIAKKRFEKLTTDFYEAFTADGELKTFDTFAQMYPYFQYNDSIRNADVRAAKIASNLDFARAFDIDSLKWDDIELKVIAYRNYISKANGRELAFVALQRLMERAVMKKQWNAALDTLKRYKEFFKPNDKRIVDLENILKNSDTVTIKSIGNHINTKGNNYQPIITADGKYLYFCGKNRKDNLGGEDIFVSENENGKWKKPTLVNELNTKAGNEAPVSISADGNTLLLFANSNIYYSEKTNQGWSKMKPLDMLNTKTDWQADAMITADGKAILFVSDRSGGVGMYHKMNELYHGTYNGNADIYVIVKTDNEWGLPINLGKVINTPYCDRSPFLHPDMKTLYFCSEGHGGLGRLDIFKSTRLSDSSWTAWSEPVHLGREVNTAKDDWGYKITTDGLMAYFSSLEGRTSTISVFDLPIYLRPDMTATVSGKLLDSQGYPVTARIRWEDLTTGKSIGEATVNPIDGSYFIVLPLGKMYGYYIEKPDYFPVSNHLDLKNEKQKIEIKKDLKILTINELKDKKIPVCLNNLFFDFNKADLKIESYLELNRLAELIKTQNIESVEIGGHTDNVGSETYNQKLSQNRAETVKEYLIKQGCKAETLIPKGYGSSSPSTTNDTDEGRAANRRVEITILK